MQTEKRRLPRLLYYLLVSSLTNLVFLALGILIFYFVSSPTKFDSFLIVILLLVLLPKSLIAGFISNLAHKRGRIDKVTGTSFIGRYFGRFYGFVVGAFLGFQIAKGVGAVAGALLFYFVGRWAGSKVGLFIGRLIDSHLPVADLSEIVLPQPSAPKKIFVVLYAAVFPSLMVLIAMFFEFYEIEFAGLPTTWLPFARIIVMLLSLYAFAAPWIFQKRMSVSQTQIPAFTIHWLGLVLSVIPVIFGFFLFSMGASIVELGFFALAASLAAIIWSRKANAEIQKAG